MGGMTAEVLPVAGAAELVTDPDAARVRVMVVDDERAITELLTLSLQGEGWLVRSVGDGREAAALADHFHPDAVLLDLMLPGLNGLQVLRQLKHANPALPVLLMTARDSEDDRIVAIAMGADAYLAKPFVIAELVARVRALLLPGRFSRSDSDEVS